MLEAIVNEHGRLILQRFVVKYSTDLAARTSGLVAVLDDWVGSGGGFAAAWDLSFGQCAQAVATESPADPVAIATAIGLRLSATARTGPWEARLRVPARLRVGDTLLPLAETLRSEWTADGPLVRIGVGRTSRTTAFGPAVRGQVSNGVDVLAAVRLGKQKVDLLDRSAVDGFAAAEERERSFERVGPEIAHDVKAAFAVLRRHAPAYAPWITRVLRAILPQQRASPDLLESGSSNRRPGLVTMTFPVEPAPCGELLVHESTHQYLYLLERTGQLDNGSDAALYYSPVKRTDRPIRAILLAFHAMANVLLYYRMCLNSGLKDGGYCERQEELLLPQLHELLRPLRRSKGLTPAGVALWKPLAAAIGA